MNVPSKFANVTLIEFDELASVKLGFTRLDPRPDLVPAGFFLIILLYEALHSLFNQSVCAVIGAAADDLLNALLKLGSQSDGHVNSNQSYQPWIVIRCQLL